MTSNHSINQKEHNNKNTPNHLINETSPYLQQHVFNLVDWYPWGDQAIEKAKKENKLIFLSIGYSTCHWCHVMAHESFEDLETAEYMNHNFVSIKIDREERPDLDQMYQSVLQIMGGNGGWPLSIFMTSDLEPIYAGTYFPVKPKYGMIAFKDLLNKIVEFHATHKVDIKKSSEQLFQVLRKMSASSSHDGEFRDPNEEDLNKVTLQLISQFDEINGGFNDAPKFPDWPVLLFLIRQIAENKKEFSESGEKNKNITQLKSLLTLTLDNMASGGIYDHIGGGFHRYSVDSQWLVPHFEKMLYDNALALQVYSEAYQIFHKPRYLEVVKEIVDWLKRDMLSPKGVFYSAMDADSEGTEGKFYVWTKNELDSLFSSMRDGTRDLFYQFYGVTESGNFEHSNILHIVNTIEEISNKNSLSIDSVKKKLEDGKKNVLVARNKRVPPATDTKILTSWNALVIHGLYSASKILDNTQIKELAHTTVEFITSKLYDAVNKKLYAVYDLKTESSKLNANLDDYSYLIQALFDDFLYFPNKITFKFIQELINEILMHFWDISNGGFYNANDLNTDVSVRMKTGADMPLPSGNSVMMENLLQLYFYTLDTTLQDTIEKIISVFENNALAYPVGYGAFLQALQWYLFGSNDIAVVFNENTTHGALSAKEDHIIQHDILKSYYIPRLHVQIGHMNKNELPAFLNKDLINNKATYYVCHHFNCSAPETDIIKYKQVIDQLFIN
jgi:uncharacterized protein YyaL (SSP411 family)